MNHSKQLWQPISLSSLMMKSIIKVRMYLIYHTRLLKVIQTILYLILLHLPKNLLLDLFNSNTSLLAIILVYFNNNLNWLRKFIYKIRRFLPLNKSLQLLLLQIRKTYLWNLPRLLNRWQSNHRNKWDRFLHSR